MRIQKATGDFPTKKEGRSNQKLYVARADKGSLFKVGISNNPKARLREMQVGSSARLRGMLCIGCLEARVRRQLRPDDFCDCPLNNSFDANKSQRLLARLGRASGDCQTAR